MSRIVPTLLVGLLLGFSACKSAPETPIVVKDGGGIQDERDAPPVRSGPADLKQDLLDPNRVVARVNDEYITVRSIQARYGAALKTLPDEQVRGELHKYTLRLIAERLFLQAAGKLGVKVTKEDLERDRKRAEAGAKERGTTVEEDLALRGIPIWEWEAERRRVLLAEKFKGMALGTIQPISPETRARFDAYVNPKELRAWYDRHQDEFRIEDAVKLGAVYVHSSSFEGDREKAKEYAENLAKRGRGGEDFAKLVKEVQGNSDPMFPKALDRSAMASLAPGAREFVQDSPKDTVSDPITMPNGYLVLKILDRQTARVVPFEEARQSLENHLYGLKLSIGALKLQLDLLEAAVVTPRSYKDEIRRGLKDAIRQSLIELNG